MAYMIWAALLRRISVGSNPAFRGPICRSYQRDSANLQSMPAESGIDAGTPLLVVQAAVTLVK